MVIPATLATPASLAHPAHLDVVAHPEQPAQPVTQAQLVELDPQEQEDELAPPVIRVTLVIQATLAERVELV
jgi:hypothetical protein